MIICKRLIVPDDHLREVGQSGWSFARGQSILMIFCKRQMYQDDHLQEASPSGWSFERGRSIRMIIWKRPVDQDDHLQEAGRSGWSFARGKYIRMIICKRQIYQDDHLYEAGPSPPLDPCSLVLDWWENSGLHPLRRPVKKHIFHDLFAYKKQSIRLVEQNPIAHNRAVQSCQRMILSLGGGSQIIL